MDLAVELGYFAREGVEVELVRVDQTPLAVAALMSGAGDMANIGVDALLQLQVQGTTTLKAVISPNKSLPFLIATKEQIAKPSDLLNHSFGVGRVGSNQTCAPKHLRQAKSMRRQCRLARGCHCPIKLGCMFLSHRMPIMQLLLS
jgi:NitT/TauT family transport system substrate-binding protein